MNPVDTLIVGGGVIGAAILQALAGRGHQAQLLEQGAVASGATGHSGGMVRVFHGDSWLSDRAAESLPRFQHFASDVGEACGFVQTGALYVAAATAAESLTREAERLMSRGIALTILTPTEARQRFPAFTWADDDWVVFEPGAGYAQPRTTTEAWLRLAVRQGATVHVQTGVESLMVENGRITGVWAAGQRWPAKRVVLAGGAWNAALLRPLGIDAGLELRTIQVSRVSDPGPPGTVSLPCFLDLRTPGFGRPDPEGGAWIGSASVAGLDPLTDTTWQADEAARTLRAVAGRLPAVAAGELAGGLRASDAYTPDRRGRLGFCPGVAGLFLACGWGGTGFKLAPAIGEMAADLLLAAA